MTDKLQLVRDPRGVVTVRLNRPEVHNAFDDQLIVSLTDTLLELDRDAAVRVIILTGAGKSFSSGADLNWMRSMAGYSEEDNIEDALRLAELMSVLNGLRKPSIARVNGHVFGGGVGLVACCDVVVCVDSARLALSEVRLGLVPAVISPYVVAAMGERQARRYFLSGEAIPADRARETGLVHEVVASDDLDDKVEEIVAALLAGGPEALVACKSLVANISHHGVTASQALKRRTAELIAQLRAGEEGQEGLAAFLEKRKPGWRN